MNFHLSSMNCNILNMDLIPDLKPHLPLSAVAAAAASMPSSAVLVKLTTSEMTPRNRSNLNLELKRRKVLGRYNG